MQKGFAVIELFIVVTILAVFGLGLYFWWINQPSLPSSISVAQLRQDLLAQPSSLKSSAPQAPRLEFAQYNLDPSLRLPKLPQEIKVFTLQTNFSANEVSFPITPLGLKLDPHYTRPQTLVFTNLTNPEQLAYLITDPTTGAFTFRSFGVHKATSVAQDASAEEIAQAFLRENGLWEQNLSLGAVLKDSPTPSFTQVIFHRDWQKMGLPIVNPVGLLNLPLEQKIASLKPTVADDFNTLKVTLDKDGRIRAINSNLRPLAAVFTLSRAKLKSPQTALKELQNGQGVFQISAPVGTGRVDYNRVYPHGIARAPQATVTDFSLVYLEKHTLKQAFLQPVYLLRGRAQLESGYTVNWTQTLPAVQNRDLAKLSVVQKLIQPIRRARAQTNYDPYSTGLNIPGLGTFVICGESHTYCFKPETASGEQKTVGEIRDLFFGKLAEQYVINLARALLRNGHLLATAENASSISQMDKLFAQANAVSSISQPNNCNVIYACSADTAPFRKPAEPRLGCWDVVDDRVNEMADKTAQALINALAQERPTPLPSAPVSLTPTKPAPTSQPDPSKVIFDPLSNPDLASRTLVDWAKEEDIFSAETRRCITYTYVKFGPSDEQKVGPQPIRISGESPTLFLYNLPEDPPQIRLPQKKLTYAEPLLAHRLYYEYDPGKVGFSSPEQGYVIARTRWASGFKRIADRLGLNPKEQNALFIDVQRVVQKLPPSPYLKVALIAPSELNQQLPVLVKPAPQTFRRVHFMITPLKNYLELPKPTISALKRRGFTIVEVGAHAKE